MSIPKDPVFDLSFKAQFLHPRYWLTWFSIALHVLLAWTPVFLRDRLAAAIAALLVRFAKKQCYIASTNLELCFPDLDAAGRKALLRDSLRIGAQTFLAFAEASFLPRQKFLARFDIEGWEHVAPLLEGDRPIIFMIPHSWSIDMAGLYMTGRGLSMCTMMHSAKNPVYDWFINRQRACFGGKVYERSVGIKPAIRALKEGRHFFYLPDQDHGADASVFVPFFGEPKATLPALPKLAKLTNAWVVPMFASYNPGSGRYHLLYRPALEAYPGGDLLTDTRRMNEEIEIMLNPRREQYMWFLKYFQTRPDGGADGFYEPGIRRIRQGLAP